MTGGADKVKALVTGAAGFIGAHLCGRLLAEGHRVIGVDHLSDFGDPALKRARLKHFCMHSDFQHCQVDICDRQALARVFAEQQPQTVVHLAAQAGTRHSVQHPHACIEANVNGFLNVLEECRRHGVRHLVYASSSSVYGAGAALPFALGSDTDQPLSLYGASKKANELMAHAYSHLHRLPVTGLRFFTVYGPWGRPDMALSLFAGKMLAGKAIDLFNQGQHLRDFTYIDDLVEAIVRALPAPPAAGAGPGQPSAAPCRLYNIGSSRPVALQDCIDLLQEALGAPAKINPLPLQAGDMLDTHADVDAFAEDFSYRPATSLEEGVRRFAEWYRDYHKA